MNANDLRRGINENLLNPIHARIQVANDIGRNYIEISSGEIS